MSKHLYFTKDIDFGQQNVVYFYGKCITYFNRSHKGICFFRLTRKNSACCPQLADSRRRLQLRSRFYRGGGSGAPAKKYTKGAAPGRARLLWLEGKKLYARVSVAVESSEAGEAELLADQSPDGGVVHVAASGLGVGFVPGEMLVGPACRFVKHIGQRTLLGRASGGTS